VDRGTRHHLPPGRGSSAVDVVTGGRLGRLGLRRGGSAWSNFIIDKNFVGFKGKLQGRDRPRISMIRSPFRPRRCGASISRGDRGHIEIAGEYNNRPDTALLIEQKWYSGTYLVANPGITAANQASNASPSACPRQQCRSRRLPPSGAWLLPARPNNGFAGIPGGVGAADEPHRRAKLPPTKPYESGTPISPIFRRRASPNSQHQSGRRQFVPGHPLCPKRARLQQGKFRQCHHHPARFSNGGSLTDPGQTKQPWQTLGNPNKTYSLFPATALTRITDTIKASAIKLNYGYSSPAGRAYAQVQAMKYYRPGDQWCRQLHFLTGLDSASHGYGTAWRSVTLGTLNVQQFQQQ